MTGNFHSHSLAETREIAKKFAHTLQDGDIVAFRGGLGAGKTAFTHGIAEGLGVHGEVSSPTFALVHEYPGKVPMYHFDMYRIQDMDDLYTTGFFDYLDAEGVLVVEWSENIDSVLPQHTIYVEIIPEGEHSRRIKIYKE